MSRLRNSGVFAFDRSRLPPPILFYAGEVGPLGRPNGKGWTLARGGSPCHESRSGRSFFVNLRTGKYHCFGCGKHGSIVDFVMMRDGVDFPTACQALGVWRGVSDDERQQIDLQNMQRRQQKGEEARLKQLAHDELIQLRNEIHLLVVIQAETSTRLSELLVGATQDYPDEVEHCWAVLSLVLDDLRQTEADYMAKAGLEYVA